MFELPALELVRPLAVFGATFRVEVSTALTLAPSTVIHAATGMTLQTFVSKQGLLLPARELEYALAGKHKLTATTRTLALRAVGPADDEFAKVLDGEAPSEAFMASTAWQDFSDALALQDAQSMLGLAMSMMVELDRQGAEQLESDFLEGVQTSWRALGVDIAMPVSGLLENSLMVIASVERAFSSEGTGPSPKPSVVLELLGPKYTPMGHWLKLLCEAVRCKKSYPALEGRLLRADIRHHGHANPQYPDDLPITVDALKGWGSVKPGRVMPLSACNALLELVTDEGQVDRLRARFNLARFLAFMCDLVRSSTVGEAPSWAQAQALLQARYGAISSRLPNGLPGPASRCQT